MATDFLLGKLGLASTLTEAGIDDSDSGIMVGKAYGGGIFQRYEPLSCEDIRKMLATCL